MKRLKEGQLDPKIKKKRGFYFDFAIGKPLSKKYHIPPQIVSEVRRFGIHKKLGRQESIDYITKKFDAGEYNHRSHTYGSASKLKEIRKQLRAYLATITDEEYADITRLTKWDWDYEGEDRKLPIIE